MKVLLVEDIEKLGWLGDVVDVKDGYARNYLLPQGLAQQATEANVKAIAEEKAIRAEKRLQERQRMEKACEAVNGAEVVLSAKANEMGHLFGSISERDIAENLRGQGFTVADAVVKMAGHIKEVGQHEVKLRFAQDITAMVNVVVVAEGAEPEAFDGAKEETTEGESTDTVEQG